MGEILGAGATLIVGIATVFFAYNYRRQIGIQTAQRRIDAYGALWTCMHVARPTRREIDRQVLTRAERWELERQMSLWYFTDGSGMLLTLDARQMYFGVKRNLVAHLDHLEPELARDRIQGITDEAERAWERGRLHMRQLSLLRTLMKSDLDIYGRMYGDELTPEDVAFIEYCKLDTARRPWRVSWRDRLLGRDTRDRIEVPKNWRTDDETLVAARSDAE
jgi:hypothetical protein